jgi:hypothetical protein
VNGNHALHAFTRGQRFSAFHRFESRENTPWESVDLKTEELQGDGEKKSLTVLPRQNQTEEEDETRDESSEE